MSTIKYLHSGLKASVIGMALLFSSLSHADCTYELFTISSAKGTTIASFVDQLSDECGYSVVISDTEASRILQKQLNKTNVKNMTIEEVFNLVLADNNLNYTLENNILRISYLQTTTYYLDYIISERRGVGSTDVTLSTPSGNNMQSGGTSTGTSGSGTSGTSGGSGNDSQAGIKIETTDEVKFWQNLDEELRLILNRPEDEYKAEIPIINKNAGMITVTATSKQHNRLSEYLADLQKKVQYQVLIDVNMLSVTFSDSKTTGVDWSQLYSLQNMDLSLDLLSKQNVLEWTGAEITTVGSPQHNNANLFRLSGKASINEVIKFLKTQGDVHSLSNPKILTLNNQPALITVGTEYFYKISQSSNQQGSAGGVAATTQNDIINSVFAGVLLDITPEISDDDTITLRINPSISQTTNAVTANNAGGETRNIPPDLDRRQLASVVTVKDNERIVLGGLINSRVTNKNQKVPLLGDIPGLSYLFKYDTMVKEVEELVIIIRPHIIRKAKSQFSLADLGYEGLSEDILDAPRSHIKQ